MGVGKNLDYMTKRKHEKGQGVQSARPRYEMRENHDGNYCTKFWEGFSDFFSTSLLWHMFVDH